MEVNVKAGEQGPTETLTSSYIDWYSEGETRIVDINGVRVVVRFVGRKGRRGRIVIEAPAGAKFSSSGMGAEQPKPTNHHQAVGRSD